jgi:hypothetical protein
MDREFNFVNNVLFNWRHRTVDGGDQTTLANIINNYYKPGPATPDTAIRYRIAKPERRRGKNAPVEFGKFYVDGNVVEGNEQVTVDNWAGGVQLSDPGDPELAAADGGQKLLDSIRVKEPFPMADIKMQAARDAYEAVLSSAGATLPRRDGVDNRIIEIVRSGKPTYDKGIVTDIAQVGGYPQYSSKSIAKDAEAAYSEAIEKRSADVVSALDLKDSAKAARVQDAINIQYRCLRAFEGDRATISSLHDQFLAKLAADLTPQQVEVVKDKMTYNKVQVTYDGYVEIVQDLTDDQKKMILTSLKQAREEAMDAGSAEAKSAIFKKYKGKINNALSAQGHNVSQDYKDWGQKQKSKASTRRGTE